MGTRLMKLPIRHVLWFGLVGLLAVGSMLACDTGTTTVTTERPAERPAPTSTPEEPPTAAPTSATSPTSTLAPAPTSTQAPVPTQASAPTPTSIPATGPTSTSTPAPAQTSTLTPTSTSTPAPASTAAPTLAPEPVATSTATTSESTPPPELVISVSTVRGDLPPYDRDDWRHWVDEDGDCQNTRHEVLIEESQAAVTYTGARECQVDAGQWFGAFTATTVMEASKLDVDHLVPLANAHQSGGWAWTPERKEQYANNLEYPGHLIAVTAGANRSKGAKSPDEWRPPNESYWCEYAVAWITVKQTWELTATPPEAEALEEMLGTCASPPELTVIMSDPASAAASPTPTPSPEPTPSPAGDAVYDSCDEAEEAGEQRVRGSSGSGRGFPRAMVPSAGDGDGDGIVCER